MSLPGALPSWLARMPLAWRLALLSCAIAITIADTALLGAGTGFLTSGFNSAHIDWLWLSFVFLPVSLILDLWLVLSIWSVAIPVIRRLSPSPIQRLCGATLLGLGLPVAFAAARYNVYGVWGDMFSVVVARQFSGLGLSELAVQAFAELPYDTIFLLPALAAATAMIVIARRLEARYSLPAEPLAAPPARALLPGVAVLGAFGTAAVLITAAGDSELLYGFERKGSGGLLATLIGEITDFDRDGFGALVHRPPDPAPFDASVYPYAIDVPGNGIDENRLAGDHPPGFVEETGAIDVPRAARDSQPHVLLIYLESFRADLLGRRHAGREITPFLNRLAREGRASAHAYAHAPWTLDSRQQLFTGALVAGADRTTLVDDFKGRGYTVAHFSGQDESYGDSVSRLGLARADFLYDARQDVERRTSRSVAPVSLQVSWKTLLSRMDDFLTAWDDSGPLYLYVNIVDSHFPYWHPEIDPILPGPELRRSDIRERNADHVRAGYANSAANVDLAVARVVAAFRQRIGGDDHAILVTADHGQALYEEGVLGHGQSLAEEQTRVPFILWGVGGDWPEPLGPADVRQLLLRNLDGREGGDPPRARFVPDPERRVLQYVPSLSNPSRIALQGLDDRLEYRFGDRLARVARDGSRVPLPSSGSAFERLVWRWEALQRRSEGFPDTPKDQ